MSRIIMQGERWHRLRSLWVLLSCSLHVLLRRAVGRPLVPQWSAQFEMATLFYRRQFNHAFALKDMEQARRYLDSMVLLPDALPRVTERPPEDGGPRGHWVVPQGRAGRLTLLYLHGGGYAFYAEASKHFIALLAERLELRAFVPDYRMTPEHSHPAQLEDALAAYRFLLEQGVAPQDLVVAGDSAGGHLCLMLLSALNHVALPQPALAIGLSPWTDIGLRGASQFSNDRYDLVQGYQTLLYGEWLAKGAVLSAQELSPMGQDYSHVSPIYLQAGGKEILVDMIRDFAHHARTQGARIRLDVWPHMNHEFHAYDDLLPESQHAMACLRTAISCVGLDERDASRAFNSITETEVDTWTCHTKESASRS